MTLPDIELPDDVEALKAMVLAMAEKAARVEALEKQVDDLEARNADADQRIERLWLRCAPPAPLLKRPGKNATKNRDSA